MHRVFVTGGTGFVGRAVVHAVRADTHIVRCLVRRGSERDLDGFESIERVEGDVLAPQTLEAGMSGCDTVIHLVGIIREHPARGITFERIHVAGTHNVLEAAARTGVRRIVHMSALGARGGARSRYHQTKWRAEEAVRASGLQWTIFRPSIIYGRGDGFVTPLAKVVRRAPVVPVIGTGDTRLQPVPVEHVAEAFARAVDNPATVGRTFEACGPDPVTFNELLDAIGSVLGRRRVLKIRVPRGPAAVATRVLERLPFFPLTTDQLLMLEEDNTCDPTPFFQSFGLAPIPLAMGLARLLG
jgi:NADH dehydrogenase